MKTIYKIVCLIIIAPFLLGAMIFVSSLILLLGIIQAAFTH